MYSFTGLPGTEEEDGLRVKVRQFTLGINIIDARRHNGHFSSGTPAPSHDERLILLAEAQHVGTQANGMLHFGQTQPAEPQTVLKAKSLFTSLR